MRWGERTPPVGPPFLPAIVDAQLVEERVTIWCVYDVGGQEVMRTAVRRTYGDAALERLIDAVFCGIR
jgi:hypothetical protein